MEHRICFTLVTLAGSQIYKTTVEPAKEFLRAVGIEVSKSGKQETVVVE
jgi:hypothetical protein